MFEGTSACIGVEVVSIEIKATNIGTEPLAIQTGDFYSVDNVPPFPLTRDVQGNPIIMQDYFIGNGPTSMQPAQLPLYVQPGQTRTIYVNFLSTRNGLRRARAFIQTNGVNFFGSDTAGDPERGTINFELGGHGIGSYLSHATEDKRPESVVFNPTDVRDTSYMTGYIRNTGMCNLFVSASRFRLVAGDVDEFAIVSTLSSPIDANGNHVIGPGGIDSFRVSFTPSRSGSRRASILLRTNDTSLIVPGITERGTHYLDLYGSGRVGLEYRPVTLPPAVIDGPGSTGIATLENTSAELVSITKIQIVNGTGEIVEDPANTWPARPFFVDPGEFVDLGLAFNATPGSQPGERTATLEITLSNGQVISIPIRGIAGTRLLNVLPPVMFGNVKVAVGDETVGYAVVSNTGTLPVEFNSLNISGPDAANYQALALKRRVVEAGQIEILQVAYAPQSVGASNGTLTISSNATNGPHTVTLGGEGTSTIGPPAGGEDQSTAPTRGGSVSRRTVTGTVVTGVRIDDLAPNPADDRIDLSLHLPFDATVSVSIYDERGRVVRDVVTAEAFSQGEARKTIDTRNLPSGVYFIAVEAGGARTSRAFRVVR
jgi:hypothetical protein